MSENENQPLFCRADHVSLTVGDLEASLAFYQGTFDARLLYRMGPFDAAEIPPMEDGRDWSEAHINVAGARLHIAMIELFGNLRVELFQYPQPLDAVREPPRNCNTGASHLCIEVTDIEAALSHLEGHGCRRMAGPIRSQGGPCPDSDSWYVLDPFGHQMELVQYH